MGDNLIGENAIKISCLQVKPGYEFGVAKKLKEGCKKLHLDDLVIFKGFGTWDLILIYEVKDFDHKLTSIGPIDGILNTITFFCFPYMDVSKRNVFFENIKKAIFTCFILIKLNTENKNSISEIHENIAKQLDSTSENNWIVLGTIGWNEIILIRTDDNLENITNEIYELTFERKFCKNESLLIKTFSQLAINHDYLPKNQDVEQGVDYIEKLLNEYNLDRPISSKLIPTIRISSEPFYYKQIITYWQEAENKFDVYMSFGDFDISVSPNKEITWSYFISQLLFFRHSFTKSLCLTYTSFSLANIGQYETDDDLQEDELSFQKEIIEDNSNSKIPTTFEVEELFDLYGSTLGNFLANHFYYLNSLSQHPITGSSFKRMSQYPKNIIETSKQIKQFGGDSTVEYHALVSSMILSKGEELRSYGTYGNIQKNYSSYARLSGGVQRAVLAMEFLPSFILKRFGSSWKGFIIAQEPKFSHYNDVIWVPTEALWKPKMWWALYHETAHIMIDRTEWITLQSSVIKDFLKNKRLFYHKHYFYLIIEICSEIIGYELGFFRDINLYLRLLWEHLIDIESMQNPSKGLNLYLVRTFALELFQRLFINTEENKIGDEDFKNSDLIYEEFLKHIEKVEEIINTANFSEYSFTFPQKKILAASNIVLFKEFLPIFQHLYKCFSDLKKETGVDLQPDPKGKEDPNTQEILKNIKRGSVYWNKIKHPEAVLYNILTDTNDMRFKENIAFILTFWNASLE